MSAPVATRPRIHLSRAEATDVEERYVLNALRSGWVAPLGPDVDAFEQEMAQRVGVSHALALSSGTAGLHLALLEMGARPGTVVVLPSMTFAATANAVVYTGATPVFVDSVSDGNVSPELLAVAIDTLRAEGQDVVAAITVDLFGRCADYTALEPVLAARGVPFLDDAAEALGATHAGRAAGSFGRAGVLSFNGNKIMTTSGGGMLLSDDADLIARCRYLSTQARQPAVHYEHAEVGYNYRLSNILAALGRGQLSRLDSMIERRRAVRNFYEDALGDLPGLRFLGRSDPGGDAGDNCWLTCVEMHPALGEPGQVMARLDEAGVESRPLWKPMHAQPVFASHRGFLDGTAQRLFERGLALPSGVDLSNDDLEYVASVFREAVGHGD